MVAGSDEFFVCPEPGCKTKTLLKDIRFKKCRNCFCDIPPAVTDKANAIVETASAGSTISGSDDAGTSGSEDANIESTRSAYRGLLDQLNVAEAKITFRKSEGAPVPEFMFDDIAQIKARIAVADKSLPIRAEAIGLTAAAEANRLKIRKEALIENIQTEIKHQQDAARLAFSNILALQKELHEVSAKRDLAVIEASIVEIATAKRKEAAALANRTAMERIHGEASHLFSIKSEQGWQNSEERIEALLQSMCRAPRGSDLGGVGPQAQAKGSLKRSCEHRDLFGEEGDQEEEPGFHE